MAGIETPAPTPIRSNDQNIGKTRLHVSQTVKPLAPGSRMSLPAKQIVHGWHGHPFADAHQRPRCQQCRQPHLYSKGGESSGHTPPDNTKSQHKLAAKFVCPDTTQHLSQ
eukprot:GHUV01053357.1.p1 GENE.GHUV01053357.1~~GHUV01053357.1.p1  ORF type:complete len:110 (+),score=17.23 GHUV01053357.1:103-432(+)